MNLNYEKIKKNQDSAGGQWTSYSDLFMMLSTVFLLLFIVANLRTGSSAVSTSAQFKLVQQENEDLKKQLKVYEVLKDDYAQKGASQQEVELYKEVVGKLTLLESDARSEREQLFKQAAEAQEKEQALNQYQKIVKNIINANLLAQSKVKRREQVIDARTQELTEAETEVVDLSKDVRKKEATIRRNTATIAKIETDLDRQVKALQQAYKQNKTTKQKMQAAIQKLRSESTQKISKLESENQTVASQLKIVSAEAARQGQKAKQLETTLSQKEQEYSASVNALTQAKEQALAQAKQQFESKLKREKLSAQAKIEEERKYRERVEALNQTYNSKVASLESELDQTQKSFQNVSSALQKKSAEAQKLMSALEQKENEYQRQISAAQRAQEQRVAQAQAEFEKQLAAAKLSGQQKLEAERRHRAQLEAMNQQFNQKLQGLNQQLGSTQNNLKSLEQKYAGAVGDLTKLKNERKAWAQKIQGELAKNGIKAEVDGGTGDVTINFGDEYFDTGQANLKPGMRQTVERFFPIYAKSLMEDKKLASRLNGVEIVGFASPTYRGKYVDPTSLAPADRAAVNYNMDLSYQRAKSIFEHVFNPTKMQYEHQRSLLPHVKVIGRSYLATDSNTRGIASSSSGDDYCRNNDCKKAQRVIIRFNLRETE